LLQAIKSTHFIEVIELESVISNGDLFIANDNIIRWNQLLSFDGKISNILKTVIKELLRGILYCLEFSDPVLKVWNGFWCEYVITVKDSAWWIDFGHAQKLDIVMLKDTFINFRVSKKFFLNL
jgi:hypothetical protein